MIRTLGKQCRHAVALIAVMAAFSAMDCDAATPFVPNPVSTHGNFGNDIVYYILVDRFFDGNQDNNVPQYAFPDSPSLSTGQQRYNALCRAMLPMTFDPSRRYMGLYWGGDLQGVINKLDYLADLGVTKIVLSPIMENAVGFYSCDTADYFLHRSMTDGADVSPYARMMTAYHGYWTRDWFQIDPHFRNPEDEGGDRFKVFRTLLNEAAQRGIGVMLDITLNQTSPIADTFVDGGNIYYNGTQVAHFDLAEAKIHDTGWFHRYRPIDFSNPSQKELQHGTLSGGMPDMNQNTPEVSRYLLDATKFWLRFNEDQGGTHIAGFRVDAIKHVATSFWLAFEDVVLANNPAATLLGEYFSGGYFNPYSVTFIDNTKYFSQYDFNLSTAAGRFFAGDRQWDGRTYALRELVLGRDSPREGLLRRALNPGGILQVPDQALKLIPNSTAATWAGFLENHDLPRLRSAYPNMSDDAYESAIRFLLTIPRVPMLLYGTETGLAVPWDPREQGLFGIGGDPFSRPMMIFPGQPGWNENIHRVTKTMIRIRKAYPLLRYGSAQFLNPAGSNAVDDLFMLRTPDPKDTAEAGTRILFAYSTTGGRFSVNVSEFPQKTAWDVETGEQLIPDGTGMIRIGLGAERSRVFVFAAQAPQTDSASHR